MNRRFTYLVLGALLLGVLVGFVLHEFLPDPAIAAAVAGDFSIAVSYTHLDVYKRQAQYS